MTRLVKPDTDVQRMPPSVLFFSPNLAVCMPLTPPLLLSRRRRLLLLSLMDREEYRLRPETGPCLVTSLKSPQRADKMICKEPRASLVRRMSALLWRH
ncbi:hypothetical protein Aduo_001079 [Ancylostoma duodenale]